MAKKRCPSPQHYIYCRKCWYILNGLQKQECPECGREFDASNTQTYRRISRRKWLFQIYCRIGVCTIVLVCIISGWVYHCHAVEQKIANRIQILGGYVSRMPAGPQWWKQFAAEHAPQWCIQSSNAYGLPIPTNICDVMLDYSVVQNDDLRQISQLNNLEALSLLNVDMRGIDISVFEDFKSLKILNLRGAYGMSVPDVLISLSNLSHLKYLFIDATAIGDKECELLGQLKNLEALQIGSSPISDNGLKHLQYLTQMRTLDISFCNITDVGLQYLDNMSELDDVSLSFTKITDIGAKTLSRRNSIKKLDVSNTTISDSGLLYIQKLTNLEQLDISYTLVSEEGLRQLLAVIQNLKWLQINGIRITPEAMDELQNSMPHLIIGDRQTGQDRF